MKVSATQTAQPARSIAIISDILLWGVLLLAVSGLLYFFLVMQPEGRQQSIRLPFQDANEITRGAMVRMMGMDVGYVQDIQLKPHYVDIILKTYPESIPIPSGSTFTVLFTGIAGSKSIEVVPPEAERPSLRGKPVYIVKNPIRLRQALQYQIDIAEALKNGAENFADFFGKKRPVEELQYNILTSQDMTATVKHQVVQAKGVLQEKQKSLAAGMQDIRDTVTDFAEASDRAATILDSHYLAPSTYATLRYFGLLFAEGEASMLSFQNRQGFQRNNHKITQMAKRLRQGAVSPALQRPKEFLGRADQGFVNFRLGVDRVDRFFGPQAYPKLRQAHQTLHGWNCSMRQVNQRF